MYLIGIKDHDQVFSLNLFNVVEYLSVLGYHFPLPPSNHFAKLLRGNAVMRFHL